MKLTVKQCQNAKPRPKPYKLSDGHGLILEVMPNGSKLWRKRYRFAGKEKSLSFGSFPDVSLQEARLKSNLARAEIKQGIDPSALKQKIKRDAISNAENSFQALAIEWHERRKDTLDKKHGDIGPKL